MMITGELKSKIDSIWEIFWTGGLTNPLDVIEQHRLEVESCAQREVVSHARVDARAGLETHLLHLEHRLLLRTEKRQKAGNGLV